MKAEITDQESLRSLRPLDVTSYLHSTGWNLASDLSDKASLWTLAGNHDLEVLVPKRQAFGDYAIRVSDILSALSSVEKRSQLSVYADIAAIWSDLVRFRSPSRDVDQGTIALRAGVEFFEGARDALLAAACSAVVKKGNYPTRKPQQASDYIERVRLGQTERGSFVVTLLCPVTPKLNSATEGIFADDPFERKVTKTLMGSLEALKQASQHAAASADFGPFQEAIQDGVSANLCSAISRLGGASLEGGLEISVSWSRSRGPESTTPRRIFIEPDALPVIQEAARLFREREPREEFNLVGFVEELRRLETDPVGRVRIAGLVDGAARRVSVDFDEPQYQIASEANTQRRIVSCTGALVKRGRSFSLLDPRDLVIVGDHDEASYTTQAALEIEN